MLYSKYYLILAPLMYIPPIRSQLDHYKNASSVSVVRGNVTPLFDREVRVVNSVAPYVLKRLDDADAVSKVAHNMASSCNQANQVAGDDCYSVKRVRIMMAGAGLEPSRDMVDSGMLSGTCDDFAQLSEKIISAQNRSRNHSDAVTHASVSLASSGGHSFTLLGDPRVESTDNIAVVDGWVNRPSAHAFSKNELVDVPMQLHSATDIMPPAFLDRFIRVITNDEIDMVSEGRVLTQQERTEAAHLIKGRIDQKVAENPDVKGLFDQDTFKSEAAVEYYHAQVSEPVISYDYNFTSDVNDENQKDAIARMYGWTRNP